MTKQLSYKDRIKSYVKQIIILLFIFKYLTPRATSIIANEPRLTSEAKKILIDKRLAERKVEQLIQSKSYTLLKSTKRLLQFWDEQHKNTNGLYFSEANGRLINKQEKYRIAVLAEIAALLLSLGFEIEHHQYFEEMNRLEKIQQEYERKDLEPHLESEIHYSKKIFFTRRFIKIYLSSNGSFDTFEITNDYNTSPLFGIIKNNDNRYHLYLVDKDKQLLSFDTMKEYSISKKLEIKRNYLGLKHSLIFGENQNNIILLGAKESHDTFLQDYFDINYIKLWEKKYIRNTALPNSQYNINDYDYKTYLIPFNNNNEKVKELFKKILENNPVDIKFKDGSIIYYLPVIELKTLYDLLWSWFNNKLSVNCVKIVTNKINLNLLINFFNTFKHFKQDGELQLCIFDIENEKALYWTTLKQYTINWHSSTTTNKKQEFKSDNNEV